MRKPFVDSNVVLYLLSGDIAKADKAQAILAAGAIISVQVLNEVTAVCLRKLKMPWQEIDALLLAVKTACEVLPLTVESHLKAIELAKRFQLSFYDAHVVASALMSGTHLLLTEDMHAGLKIETLVLANPFKAS
ncbi:PIN domain-containing protein [Rhodoferax sp.]|uniref:PIN domain-containing protein n=1 Tax=Rhodoferax sp. TaxID=50421 RepID=UPI0026393E2B|nr:PIN domain-containing protein [Rhodoferax sp.]MDD2808211.1 PIN domain-containing protein [Rhodoferax sp.]MDD4941996.1 PIN domain-containing protein [Rhodoferax sp.]MDD5480364.1 PIN domain-containing protein [Rhodoferax sp.]